MDRLMDGLVMYDLVMDGWRWWVGNGCIDGWCGDEWL
jgi:hypothetical protein